MEKKFNFVYLTTNLLNGKQYIGDHSTNDLNSSKSKNYKGSGHPYLNNAFKFYERKNFKREILEFFNTKKEAFDAQEKYIKEYNTLYPNGYNISPTGGVGVKGCCSEETKEKIRKANKGRKHSEQSCKNMGISHLGEGNGMYGKKHSKESRVKMGLTKKERKTGVGEKNGMFGKSLMDVWIQKYGLENAEKRMIAYKEKMSIAIKNRKPLE